MDTDSAYIAFSGSFEDVVKPELRQHFNDNKHKWLGRDDTEKHKLFSSKGINQKQNEITKQRYYQALNGDESQFFINKGFRVRHNQMMTNTLQKTSMK
jgi:hypothetical protein